MSETLMLLPSAQFERIRVVRIPDDLDTNEAYRFATGIIAQAEESKAGYVWEDIAEALEGRGFDPVAHILGPELD
ncbi:MAG: hypothetical protein OI74_05650 [Gammaproteobacteria bacterium (ex Lamellibrachia satsuma)]|nr:MAG: hypothetical protein HPY30_09295 [Gammaproteobacteria bacterium (ex Lamellibrachia satsuma)]RRS34264.1 MAG: hypothetical protein OI74_05650 [Gammaproteobacteria bacterium (ex Lamellibrachia satsuma)]RRS37322.1 MAG: hypothetical protein NV67_01895 [Gammaproteobacteria bacterium (ex Lamellibrachia satsuma)]